jgi:hypothetical protein
MLSNSTLKVYNSSLSCLSKDLGYEAQLLYPDGHHWLKDHQKVYNLIKLSKSPNTRNTRLYSIKYILELTEAPKELIDEYAKYSLEVKAEIEQNYEDNKKSEKEDANWLSLKQLENILHDYEKRLPKHINTMEDYKKVMRFLLLKLHMHLPVRNDFADAKIYNNPTAEELEYIDKNRDYNYLVVKNDDVLWIANVFKTGKVYGQNLATLNKDLSKDIIEYAQEIIDYTPDNVFLVNSDRDKMNRNSYTKFIKTIFVPYGKNISTTMIRHIVVSEVYGLTNEDVEKNKKKKELAKIMGHSRQTAEKIYAKVLS